MKARRDSILHLVKNESTICLDSGDKKDRFVQAQFESAAPGVVLWFHLRGSLKLGLEVLMISGRSKKDPANHSRSVWGAKGQAVH
jgi:hypothetical protein